MVPYWHAQSSAQGEWTFTGNVSSSPDYMQYRVWERQSQVEGPVISNRFTTEPNSRHLPVLFYWAIGKIASVLGARPEAVYAYSGMLLAAMLVVVLYGIVRSFLPVPAHHRWPFVALLFGGGLGGHIKILQALPGIGTTSLVTRLITRPTDEAPVFEEYRSHYVIRTFFDSHFLLLWLVCVLAVFALYLAVRHWSWQRGASAAAWFTVVTVLHVYEGVTLVAIAIGAALALRHCAPEGANARRAAIWTTAAVAVAYVALGLLFRSSGLPLPPWRAVNILALILFIAYPISYVLLAIGGRDYLQVGGVPARFVVGWAAACTLVTLSGPFFPYPDRGTMTLQVPLMIAAGAIYYARWQRLTLAGALVAVAVYGATPVWQLARSWHFSGFRTDAPFLMINAGHRQVLDAMRQPGDTGDVLLAEPRDLLWLAPEFHGRLYVGHFFLTVDYRAKNEALTRALQTPDSMPAFLHRTEATLLFVNGDRQPSRFAALAGLRPVTASSVGTLFRVVR